LDAPVAAAAFILAGRFTRVSWVLAGTGVRLGAAWLTTRPRGRRHLLAGRINDIAYRQVLKLGATFIKFGQLLSTRVDVLPPEMCAALSKLHDDVPAIRPRTARRLASQRLGMPLESVFASFDDVPVASGSIACVYRATLHDGSVVAIKIKRPGVDRVLGADLTLMRGVARLMSKLPAFRSLPVREMIAQLGGAIAVQLDMTNEAATLVALTENLAVLEGVRVPHMRGDVTGPAHTRAGILAMEFIPDLVRLNPNDFEPEARDLVVSRCLDAVFKMLFQDGFLHNDLHPGNLYFRPDGSIIIVDAGFVTRLTGNAKWQFANFFYAMATGNGPKAGDVIMSTCDVPDNFDEAGFRRELTELITANSGANSREFNLLTFATVLFNLQNKYSLYSDPEFVFPILSLLVMEGAIKEFAPNTDFQSKAIPYVLLSMANDDPRAQAA
jgi:ubiquinone biosynthesis protein